MGSTADPGSRVVEGAGGDSMRSQMRRTRFKAALGADKVSTGQEDLDAFRDPFPTRGGTSTRRRPS